jgi:Cd2+/Zn2+-exporting ATPase
MSEANEDICSACGSPESIDSKDININKYRLAIFSAIMLSVGLFFIFTEQNELLIYGSFLASMLSAGRYIIPKGIRGLLRVRLDQHFLMTAASIGAMAIGAPAEGAAVMFLFYISTLLEDRAEDRVRDEIQTLMQLEPLTITLKEDGREVCSTPEKVRKGDIIIVKPGGRIGLDGIISIGATAINQSTITGESLPVPKSVGDQVYAGTINQEGYIEVEVTEEFDSTVLSRIIRLVDESRKNRAPTEKAVSRFSRVYTPIVVALSMMIGLGTYLLGSSLVESTYRALTLLVISCPCAFAVSIPVSMVSAITGSARNGILVKGSIHIEQMSKAAVAAFDKTGTLTEGVLSVQDVCLHNNHSRREVLSAAASVEKMSEHPIAKALVEAAAKDSALEHPTSDLISIPGRGVIGHLDEKEYLIGNRRLLLDNKIPLQSIEEHTCGAGTMVYVASESEHFGTIVLSDTIRAGTKKAVQWLKEMGIRTIMLTGDSENVAREIANEIGIDDYRAELLPDEKVATIQELKKLGITMMIGDGINDTPALAAADIGIAMGAAGSDAALETADVALMDDDLTKIPMLITRAKKTMKVVHQNVATSLSVKGLTAILAALGVLTLWMAIGFGDMGLTFLVIANALRLARKV